MRNLLKSLLFLTYLLIVWGAVVRGTGSGLGCPDWPLCHGQIIPPFEKEVLIEYAHRLLACLVGILTLIVCIKVWIDKELRGRFGKKCGVLLGLLVVQVLLGGVTVKTELHPHIVATHLGIGLIFLALIFYMYLYVRTFVRSYVSNKDNFQRTNVPTYQRTNLFFHWRIAVLFIQILLGGLVAASQAGLACPDFPTCQGVWIPTMHGLVAIHFAHRVGALVILIMAISLALTKWQLPIVRLIFFLVLLQILLGIGAVMMGLPFWMRIAHNAVAVFLFLVLVRRVYELRSNDR